MSNNEHKTSEKPTESSLDFDKILQVMYSGQRKPIRAVSHIIHVLRDIIDTFCLQRSLDKVGAMLRSAQPSDAPVIGELHGRFSMEVIYIMQKTSFL